MGYSKLRKILSEKNIYSDRSRCRLFLPPTREALHQALRSLQVVTIIEDLDKNPFAKKFKPPCIITISSTDYRYRDKQSMFLTFHVYERICVSMMTMAMTTVNMENCSNKFSDSGGSSNSPALVVPGKPFTSKQRRVHTSNSCSRKTQGSTFCLMISPLELT